jgi:hypothetical protein
MTVDQFLHSDRREMGMRYKFLPDLLKRAGDAYGKVPLTSFFGKEITKLSQDDLRNLVSWCLESFKIKAGADEVTSIAESVARKRSVVIGDVAMKSDVLSRLGLLRASGHCLSQIDTCI